LSAFSVKGSTTDLSASVVIKDTIPGTADTLLAVPARQLRNSLAAKDSLDLMKRERDELIALKTQYEGLNQKDSVLITSLDKNILMADRLISNLEGQVANVEKQSTNKDQIIKEKNGIIKKKNRTIRKLIAGGTVVIGGLAYLLVGK